MRVCVCVCVRGEGAYVREREVGRRETDKEKRRQKGCERLVTSLSPSHKLNVQSRLLLLYFHSQDVGTIFLECENKISK